MIGKNIEQLEWFCGTIEDLVPEDHLLRKIRAAMDFSFIYEEVESLYCRDNGRPGTDPVMLVKYLLIGYLYGIGSEREIERRIQTDMAYRWFLGLNVTGRVPDHSTISQNRRRRFNGEHLFRRLFERVLQVCMEKGLVEGKQILTDSTHVKANASRRSEYTVQVEREAAWYMERLDRYEALERAELEGAGKISPKRLRYRKKAEPKTVEKRVSRADPEAGFLKRPGKPEGMHYLDHQSVDSAHGIIVDVAVTPGNVTDATPYLDRVEYMREHLGLPIEAVGADSAYDVSLVHQELADKEIRIFTPANKEVLTYKAELTRADFFYDQENDAFVCPMGVQLPLRSLQRLENNVCKEYACRPKDCRECPKQKQCLSPSQKSRRIKVNIFEDAVKRNHAEDGSPEHKAVLGLRQIWCEGTFAAQKARHNLSRLFRRGREAAEDHCLLSATALNLKRMVKCLG